MTIQPVLKLDPQTSYAAQNAQLGLINVADLSLLTGVEVSQLTKFAKTGAMAHYGEYHGKRFFNFQEIVNWLHGPDDHNEAKPVMRAKMNEMRENGKCPYILEKPRKNVDGSPQVKIVWADAPQI